MTAQTGGLTPDESLAFDKANYVASIVGASLEKGGPLHVQLSDLITGVGTIAMLAAGCSDDDREAAAYFFWPDEDDALWREIAGEIESRMFQTAKDYFIDHVDARVSQLIPA